MTMSDIDDTVLQWDRRGIGRLRDQLDEAPSHSAAQFILGHGSSALIVTGFYIGAAERTETDGPPGSIVLATALRQLGWNVQFVTDEYSVPLLQTVSPDTPVHSIDTGLSDSEAKAAAQVIIDQTQPSLLIAAERCGVSANGRYLQFKGTDITSFTGKTDKLFEFGVPSVGVIDGGNEIGSGAMAGRIAELPGLPDLPCVTATDRTVLGSVVNWACYGLVAALSLESGRNLLPSDEDEQRLREAVVHAGAVDSESLEPIPAVDGQPGELSTIVLRRLRALVENRGL